MANDEFDVPAKCMLCQDSEEKFEPHEAYKVSCKRCGEFSIEGMLAGNIAMYVSRSDRHLLSGYTREQSDSRKGARLTLDNYKTFIAQAPQTIREKADRLLAAIHLRTRPFGKHVDFMVDRDYPLGYAENDTEISALLRYLEERELINAVNDIPEVDYRVTLTGKGADAIESRKLLPPLTVFVSSTCYDLLDLRAELAAFLEAQGCIVRISEDPDRFNVDPSGDALRTCLSNLESSDVVVCILDRRYGAVTETDPHPDLSATHTEFRHAKDRKIARYVFLRERAMLDYYLLKDKHETTTSWVEPDNDGQRKRWLDFAVELRESKWVDQFKTSEDLKKLVLKRLADYRQTLNR